MSGTFPSSPAAMTIKIISDQPSLESISDSGKRQAKYAGGHLWGMDLTFPVMTRAEFAAIDGFVMSQDGGSEEFTYVPAHKATPIGEWGSAVSVVGAHVVDDTTIVMDGFNPNKTDVVNAGDFFKFANHSKVYMVVENSTSVGNLATLTIRPALIESIADNEVVTFQDVPFTVFVDDVFEYKLSRQGFYTYSVKLKESL